MAEIINSCNTKTIFHLLDRQGLSLDEIAASTKLKKEKIESWKNGKFPTYKEITLLSDFFKRPVITFFMNAPDLEDSSETSFRTNADFEKVINKSRLWDLYNTSKLYQISLNELNEQRLSRTVFQSIFLRLEKDNIDSSDKLFLWLRRKMDLPITRQMSFYKTADFIEYAREKLYQLGIFIFKESFKIEDISGFCVYDEKFPIIMLNNKISFTRQLFTIFHEVYHIFKKTMDIDFWNDEEKECDRFASAFLIPEEEFQKDLIGMANFEDKDFIESKASKYKVSPEAYMYKLKLAGKISSAFYSEYKEELAKNMIRMKNADISGGNYYFTKMNYLGRAYLGEISSAYFTGRIDIKNLARYTQMKASTAKKMLASMSGGRI